MTLAFLAISCEKCQRLLAAEGILLTNYQSVNVEGWMHDDTLFFDLPVQQETVEVQVQLMTRTTLAYPYRNLQLRFTLQEIGAKRVTTTIERTTDRSGKFLSADTLVHLSQSIKTLKNQRVGIELYAKNNEPTGHLHPYLQNEQSLDKIQLLAGRNYRICITHAMWRDPLEGVSDIGIKVTDASGSVRHPSSER